MTIARISLKFFAADGSDVNPDHFVPIFHRWIQQKALPGHLLLDVADYKHVPNGPGIILIAHEADIGIDFAGGQAGLLYTRKRSFNGSLLEQLRVLFGNAVAAARLLAEAEESSGLTLRTDLFQLAFLDRLRLPNSNDSLQQVSPAIRDVLTALYPDSDSELTRHADDQRRPLTVTVTVTDAPSLTTLAERTERVHA